MRIAGKIKPVNGLDMTIMDAENISIEHTNVKSKFKTIDNQININPEQFIGTDFQKLQQAIDLAIIEKLPIELTKTYNITGQGSLVITKKDRSILSISGGVIIKNDKGYVFTSKQDHGDIIIKNMGFMCDDNMKEVAIADADNMIRFSIMNCWLINCKFIKQVDTDRYLQSVKIKNNTVTGAYIPIDFYRSYDLLIENNTIEHGIGGIRGNTQADPCCNTVRIKNNVIEGNSKEKAILLGNSYGLAIENNYFESNLAGDVYLMPSITSFYNGLSITNNTFQSVKTEAAIHIKNLSVGCLSSGNVVDNKPLYKHYGNEGGAGGQIISIADQSLVSLFTKDTDMEYVLKMGNMYHPPYSDNQGIKKTIRLGEDVGGIGSKKTIKGSINFSKEELLKVGGDLEKCVFSLYGASSGGGGTQISDINTIDNTINFKVTNLSESSVAFLQVKAVLIQALQ